MTTKSYTDNVFTEVKLFVEGVQLPFMHISITSGIGGLPSANITVPAQSALLELASNYSPKVLITFKDRYEAYNPDDPVERADKDKVLFSGIITQTSYQKSKNYSGSVGISFSCSHRYSLISEMLLDYSGYLNGDPLDSISSGGVPMDTANSTASIIEALSGVLSTQDSSAPTEDQEITQDNPRGKTSVIPERYSHLKNRIQGFPGVVFNLWNQIKRSAYFRLEKDKSRNYSEAFIRMYQPLLEDGLQFLDRIGGHYPIESLTQNDMYRVDPCSNTPNKKPAILIPPITQMFLPSAVQADITVQNIGSYLQNSGEVTSIYGIFTGFFESIEYEILTLASPAEVTIRESDDTSKLSPSDKAELRKTSGVNSEKTFPLDTIIKPKLPFYFSPTCNVLFPGMYHSISINIDNVNIPTRIKAKNTEGPVGSGFQTNFLAPASIRKAVAMKVSGPGGIDGRAYSLVSTTGPSLGAIGLYEQGRGVKLEKRDLPRWLSLLGQSIYGANAPSRDEGNDTSTDAGKARKNALDLLSRGWANRYKDDRDKSLNPYSLENADINAHHRILFATADYYYTQVFARSKVGRVEGVFNPYIVPGFPMDILEANPTYPSFHAMCTSVTHTITDSSMQTSIDFTAAITYSELANYYIPVSSPMLQVALGLAESPTLISPKDDTKAIADDFYRYTLGVPAAIPDQLVDFSNMEVNPVSWDSTGTEWVRGSTIPRRGSNGGEMNPMLSVEGNLSLTQRPIESRMDVETRFDVTFIEMSPANYGSVVTKYVPSSLTDETKFEIGVSPWLEYDTYFGDPIPEPIPQPPVDKANLKRGSYN